MDLSKLSDSDLQQIAKGDLRMVSEAGLRMLSGDESPESISKPVKIGKDAFHDTLRQTLKDTDWGTRNIASAGTALSNLWEGAKQFVGKGDQQRIEANQVMRDEAPVGAIAGEVALTAAPFSLAGNSLKAAGAVGAGYGLMQPVSGEQTLGNIAQGKALNTAVGGATGSAGQYVANKAGDYVSKKAAELLTKQSQNAQRDAALKAFRDQGGVVPPDMVNPSFLNRALTGFAGKLTTQQQASAKNQEVVNALVRKEMGLPDDVALTDEVFEAFRKSKGAPYKELSGLGNLPVDDAYKVGSVGPKITGAKKQQTVFQDANGNVVSDVPPMPKAVSTRNLLNEIIKSGGISKKEMADMGVEKVRRVGLFRKEGSGKSADDLVEWMEQNEWINPEDIIKADRFNTGGSHDLARSMVKEAIDGNPVFHPSDDALAFEYGQKLSDWGAKYGNLEKVTIPGSLGKVKADDAVESLKQVRFDAKDYWKSYGRTGNPEHRKAAEALDKAAGSLEQFLERSAKNVGRDDLVPALRQARKDIAKAHSVEKALNDVTGNVSARVLGKNDYLTGNLKTVADFAKAFPKASQPVEQIGSMPGISPLDFVSSGILGGSGALVSGDPKGAGLALVPFMRPAVRNAILSKTYQGLLANPSYNVPITSRVAASLLDYAPIGATTAALESLR